MKVGFISLGCNKNLVDTEKTIALFKENNYEIVNKPEEADMIVVNTCGFIESAKEEAINTLLEMAEYKKQKCKYLVAMGCLVKRYENELKKALPEVDLYIPYGTYDTLWEQIEKLVKPNIIQKQIAKKETKNEGSRNKVEYKEIQSTEFEQNIDRVITTGQNYAYLKFL